MSGDESFLERWSRRKRAARAANAAEHAPARAARTPVAPEGKETGPKPEEEAVDPAQLPPIDSLGKDSDYSVFLRKGVPEDLRRQALRRLWASDPLLMGRDLSEPYTIDFNQVPTFPEGLMSAAVRKALDLEKKVATEAPPDESIADRRADDLPREGPSVHDANKPDKPTT